MADLTAACLPTPHCAILLDSRGGCHTVCMILCDSLIVIVMKYSVSLSMQELSAYGCRVRPAGSQCLDLHHVEFDA